jgi:phosphomannomutase
MDTELRAAVEQWVSEDPDPATRAELEALLAAGDEPGLAERFGAPLEFGTAGIRGAIGAGPARMNRAVVRRITAGLAQRLAREPRALESGVVVGRDARHKSAEFAEDAVGVLAGAGFAVRRFEHPVPTPLVAFAVRHLDAAAGIQVTASHNPPSDNGYKVYWTGGAQIVAPLDAEIAAAVAEVWSLAAVWLSDMGVTELGEEVAEAYVDACLGLAAHPDERDLRIVYTPLHGVAGELAGRVLGRAGFSDVRFVAEQADPDPDFPTVAFPNPEEPGALDLAFRDATAAGADLVLANDPDGDRIAAAVPDRNGGWRALSGDEVGCLLAEELLSRGGGGERAVATTVVSSQMLSRIAEHHGVRYGETLTGFKWLAAFAVEVEASGGRMVLAYEQALGAMCGDAVLDKDGISAALVLAELAAVRKAAGSDLLEALDELAARHGVHATAGRAVRLDGPDGQALVSGVLDKLLADPPSAVDGVEVIAVEDRAQRTRRTLATGDVEPLATPPTPLAGLLLGDGSRLQVRPSGTEPLLKFYVEVVEPPGEDVEAARARAAGRLQRLADRFVGLSLAAAGSAP